MDEGRVDGRVLWRYLARRLPAPYDAAPLFLFGWRSYRDGDGALASMAAERALSSDPGYSAADLLLAALSQGGGSAANAQAAIPPSGMTPTSVPGSPGQLHASPPSPRPERQSARHDRSGKIGRPGEHAVDGGGARAALGDRPHHQRGAPGGVAAGVDAVGGGLPAVVDHRACRAPGRRSTPSAVEQLRHSVPTKPAASSTRSAGSSVRNPAPGGTPGGPSTRTISTSSTTTARTCAGVVAEEVHDLARPGLVDALVMGGRRCRGCSAPTARRVRQVRRAPPGAGCDRARVTDIAPWRLAVPRQSAAVSPPPMMITCLPAASIGRSGDVAGLHPVAQRQVSMA